MGNCLGWMGTGSRIIAFDGHIDTMGIGNSIFRDNSTRTRFSFASDCNLLGLEVQDLNEKKSQIAHGEAIRETANMAC